MKKSSTARPVKVGLVSLGCAKNLADAEVMLGSLLREGMQITNDAASADVIIVNTCSFIESAQQESVDAILESAQVREANNRGQGLIVSGCLPQRFRNDLPAALPEVDAFMGIDQVAQAPDIVRSALAARAVKLQSNTGATKGRRKLTLPNPEPEASHSHSLQSPATTEAIAPPQVQVNARPRYIPDFATPRFRLTPRHFAYLKIAEGCNHPCSFCIIPQMRGSHRSRPQADVVAEARELIRSGVRELNLISQDSTYYGMDLRPNHRPAISSPEKFAAASSALAADATTLCSLLRELNDLPGDFWIRLLYTHPAHWTDELIRTIAECPKVARYVDMPLQHIHQNMLERMRRETSQQYIEDLIRRIRAGIPGIGLRTTFIVGFPGETEAYFETLLDFIRDTKFERLGVFTYSKQESTRAGAMAGQVPEKIRQRRRDQAMVVQREVAAGVAAAFVGREIKVLVEHHAKPGELSTVSLDSWEHGLVRGTDRDAAGLKGSFCVARGEADAPDIDGRVYVKGKLPLSEFAFVKVIGHTDYDLIAVPA
jgi:ribosomal protein S12 methylthiotransferase